MHTLCAIRIHFKFTCSTPVLNTSKKLSIEIRMANGCMMASQKHMNIDIYSMPGAEIVLEDVAVVVLFIEYLIQIL